MKRSLFCFFMVLFILSACTQPEPEPQAATATQEAIPTIEPTPTIEPHLEKLTDDFKEQTEELYGETKLEMQNGEWSLVDDEGRQVAGFIEGEWWVNYAWVGPKSIPSRNRGEYLCRDDVGTCGKINPTELAEMKVEEIPFPDNFEKNPFVKREMESIEKWWAEEMRVPLGNIPIAEGFKNPYEGENDILLKKVVLGQGKDFRWTILPLSKHKTFPQYSVPLWLAKVDEKGAQKTPTPFFYKIDSSGRNIVVKDSTLKVTYAGTPCYDQNFQRTSSDQFFWARVAALIVSDTTDEWLNNQKWTLIPYGGGGDILLVQTSGEDIYRMFWPDTGGHMWIRKLPIIK